MDASTRRVLGNEAWHLDRAAALRRGLLAELTVRLQDTLLKKSRRREVSPSTPPSAPAAAGVMRRRPSCSAAASAPDGPSVLERAGQASRNSFFSIFGQAPAPAEDERLQA